MHGQLIKIDLHVHTAKGSPCAESHHPETLPDTMVKNDIQGIVITEHNTFWSKKEVNVLNAELKHRKIYRGVEISSGNHHFIIIGIEKTDKLFPGMLPESLMKIVNDQGGIAILAHPFLDWKDDEEIPPLPGLTGVEIMSTITSDKEAKKAIGLCNRLHLKPVAGSDAHCSEKVGDFHTIFPYLPKNERELAQMIREGKGTPRAGRTGL